LYECLSLLQNFFITNDSTTLWQLFSKKNSEQLERHSLVEKTPKESDFKVENHVHLVREIEIRHSAFVGLADRKR